MYYFLSLVLIILAIIMIAVYLVLVFLSAGMTKDEETQRLEDEEQMEALRKYSQTHRKKQDEKTKKV